MMFTLDRGAMLRLSLITMTTSPTLALLGCSSGVKTYPVTLHVAYEDGTTIEGAIVAFQSVSDAGAKTKTYSGVGKVQADGTCTLTTFQPNDGLVAPGCTVPRSVFHLCGVCKAKTPMNPKGLPHLHFTRSFAALTRPS